jgi:hypothetical protein
VSRKSLLGTTRVAKEIAEMKLRSNMSCLSHSLCMTALLALCACGGNPGDAGAPESECSACVEGTPGSTRDLSVEIVPTVAGRGEIEYRLTNRGAETLSFLPWDTALEGASEKFFDVFLEGNPIPYAGLSVSRAEPDLEDLVQLAPGASLSAQLDLTRVYAMSQVGQYTVRARPVAVWPASGGSTAAAEVTSEVVVTVDTEHVYEP